MKKHFCPVEQAVISFDGECNWCGDKAVKEALAQPEQEPVAQKPFGYFQYDIRLDAWVQNRINNKGVAFYTKEQA